MPDLPHLQVVHLPTGGYAGHCSTHGYTSIWGHELLANLDLLGHAAHFHSRPLPATTGGKYAAPDSPTR